MFIAARYIRPMIILASLPVLMAALVTPVAAAGTAPSPAKAEPTRIRCESVGERWNHCRLPFQGEAVMLRQLSRTACVRNHSWGQDANGVWVARGCRAEFGPSARNDEASGPRLHARSLRCESRSGSHVKCPVDTTHGVRMTRRLGAFECELGRSWGFDDEGVWVSRGCRADFEVQVPDEQVGWLERLFGKRKAAAAPEGARALRCESRDAARQACRVEGTTRVQLVRQISNAECAEGRSWGWTANGVWVDRGCRAEFVVW